MPINEEIRIEDLFGTRKLVSTQRRIIETGVVIDLTPKGNPPFGILMYGNDGRMLVLNLTSGRPKPNSLETITDEQRVQLFRTMVAYGGTYTCRPPRVAWIGAPVRGSRRRSHPARTDGRYSAGCSQAGFHAGRSGCRLIS